MRWLFYWFCSLFAPLFPERRVSILLYHDIGESDLYLTVSPEAFSAQMAYLATSGRRVLSLEQLCELLVAREPLPARAVVVTFDDAYHAHAGIVRETLEYHGIPGTVFVPTGSIGSTLNNSEGKPQPILDADTLCELARSPQIALAPHSVTHREFITLSLAECEREVRESLDTVAQLSPHPSHCFAYPRGAYTPEHAALLERLGMHGGVTVHEGLVGPASDRFRLPRNTVTSATSLAEFKTLCSPAAGLAARLRRVVRSIS